MGNIKINITGGHGQFGNIVQGNNNTLSSSVQWHQEVNEHFDKVREQIRQEASSKSLPQERLGELETKITHLEELIKNNKPDSSGIGSIINWIKDHFEWTIPLLKPIVESLMPSLAALL